MKKGINYWSFEGGLTGEKPVGEAMQQAKAAGFDAIELALFAEGEISLDAKQEEIAAIADRAKQIGIEISSVASGLLWDYSLTANDASVREEAEEIVQTQLNIASWLGVDVVLVIPGAVDVFFMEDAEIVPYPVVYERSRSALKKLASEAERLSVHIGVENVWNKFLLSPLEMRDFVDEIGNDYVGVYFDVGNVLLTGFPDQWIRILGQRIKRVHLKDYKSSGFDGQLGPVDGFAELGDGEVDWPAVLDALAEIGYDGYLTAEMIPPTSNLRPEGIIERTSRAMDRILGREG